MTGTITKVMERGFGFIKADDGQDVFFHASSLEGLAFEPTLQEMRVEFSTVQTDKGPRATVVRAEPARKASR